MIKRFLPLFALLAFVCGAQAQVGQIPFWPPIQPGSSGFGARTNFGTATGSAGGGVAVTGTAPSGVLIIVAVAENVSATAGSVSDSAGNTYGVPISSSVIPGSGGIVMLFRAFNINALTGGTVTYTKATSGRDTVMSVFYVSGAQTSSDPLDLVTTPVTSASSGTTITITSGTPAQAGEMFVGVLGQHGSPLTYSQASGFATPPNSPGISSQIEVDGGNLINAGTGAVTFTPGLSAAKAVAALLVSFKHR